MTATIEPPTYTLLAFDPLACTAVLGDHNGALQVLAWLRPWHWQLHQQKYWPTAPLEITPAAAVSRNLSVQTVQVGLTPATVQVAYSPAERKWYRVTETPAVSPTASPEPEPEPEPDVVIDLSDNRPAPGVVGVMVGSRASLEAMGVLPEEMEPATAFLEASDTPSERKPPLTRQAWSPERRAAASAAAKAKVAALRTVAQKGEPA